MGTMLRLCRAVSPLLLALAGASMAHGVAYLLTFRCWSCHGDLMSATHAFVAGSSACVLAVIALVATLVAGRTARSSSLRISVPRLLAAQAAVLVVFQLLERHVTASPALLAPRTLVLELALLIVAAVLLARFVRVVECVVHVLATNKEPRRRNGVGAPQRRVPRVADWSRTMAYNATGFLRAPPLPA
jgi:hypothetical protein